jgi:hypothetical protein
MVSAKDVTQPLYSISIAASPEASMVGTPLKLTITVTNISDRTLTFGIYFGERAEFSYEITVTDADGKSAPTTEYYRDVKEALFHGGRTSGVGVGTLEPGKSMKDVAILTKLYDLRRPGAYAVQVRTVVPYSESIVKSNIAVVRIAN